MKKIAQTMLILVIFVAISIVLCGKVNAANDVSFGSMTSEASDWLEKGKTDTPITAAEATNSLIPIARVLVGVATIILVVVGLIMGLKYMLSGANEKANLKEKLIWYVISVVLVYGAVGIFSIIYNTMQAILK